MTKEEMRKVRENRMDTAISMQEPDRVPFAPKVSGFYMYGYDISFYDAMVDARNLKRCIMTVIENEMTPVVFCEGNYNTRLEVISDVPKGKVVYMFEKVDLKKAKATVGKVATICGSVPNAMLAFETPEQVTEETKRQLDILAPGGGFIMDCSLMLDNARHENMHAWKEATLKYGGY